ncbi:MAG: biotin carboxylase N-terminal domain-containing protein [Solirubrobacteraceae bacterium]
MFDRVLIANRGEIVARIARTLRRLGCSPATVRAAGDPARLHVDACDASVEIGSYLDVAEIVEAALSVRAQAVHPGYGFLSERADLARACAAAGLRWIGPPADAIELMADKSAARTAARAAGLPIVPGLAEPTPEEIVAFAGEHGLPLLVKAAAGGGGKGMRMLTSTDDIEAALAAARREARAAFGSDALLVELAIEPARHLEVQVLADAHGEIVDLGERECTLQRRHQKVVEETPSPAVGPELREILAAESIALARACGYVGAGTVEFIALAADPAQHYFLEMNTRLQVEHAVTEVVHGVDLVEWQVRVAAGEPLELPLPAPRGHAIEARLYAEDPRRGFLPAAGTVSALRLPAGAGIRVDAGIATGETVTTRYDPMLAKITAGGETRAEALTRLREALRATAVLGLRTNLGFLGQLLDDDGVRSAQIDTGLVERLALPPDRDAPNAALVALIASTATRSDVADPFERLAGWRVQGAAAPAYATFLVDGEHRVELALPPPPSLAELDGVAVRVDAVSVDPLPEGGVRLVVSLDGVAAEWIVAGDWVGRQGIAWHVVPTPRERDTEPGGGGEVRAPMPGSVVVVHAREGAHVARGDLLLVLESMKMELQITAPRDGTVDAVHVAAGDQVALDAVLASVAGEPA